LQSFGAWQSRRRFVILTLNILLETRMAAALYLRNLEPDLIARLKRLAARHGRSVAAEHLELLRQALAAEIEPCFDRLAAELRKRTASRKQTPSELLLREGREER
jgi:plasmid stability protein